MAEVKLDAVVTERNQLLGSKQAPPRQLPKVLPLLDVPRLIGSLHIVFFHFLSRPDEGLGPGAPWGTSWVTFFFALSGFGAAHSKLSASGVRSCTSGPWWPASRTMRRRLVSVYPTYIFAFLLAMLQTYLPRPLGRAVIVTPFRILSHWVELLMMQTWFPSSWFTFQLYFYFSRASQRMEMGFDPIAVNMPDWFVSALTATWLLENATSRLAAHACSHAGLGRPPWLGVSAVAVFVIAWPFALFKYPWMEPLHFPEVSALAYLHMPMCGALLAGWLHGRAEAGLPHFHLPLSTIATGILAIVFCLDVHWFGGDGFTLSNWVHRIGILLPIQCVLIAGLADAPADPLNRWLEARPALAKVSRDLALGVYLLQAPICAWLRSLLQALLGAPFTFSAPYVLLLCVVLCLLSLGTQKLVQKPLGAWLAVRLQA
jgi:peptidoglycan/LPS O-acetylase OafA/YrhL